MLTSAKTLLLAYLVAALALQCSALPQASVSSSSFVKKQRVTKGQMRAAMTTMRSFYGNDYMVNITALCNDPKLVPIPDTTLLSTVNGKTKKTSQAGASDVDDDTDEDFMFSGYATQEIAAVVLAKDRVRKEVTAAAKGWNPEDFNGRFKRLPKPEQTRGSLGINGKKQPGNGNQGQATLPAVTATGDASSTPKASDGPSSSSTTSTVAEKRQDASDTAPAATPETPVVPVTPETPIAPVTPTEPSAPIAAKPSGPVRPPFLRHIEPRILQGVCQFVVNSKLPSWIVATPPTDNLPKVVAPTVGKRSARSANVRRSPTWPWRPRAVLM